MAAAVRDMVAGIPAGSGIWAPAMGCARGLRFPFSLVQDVGLSTGGPGTAGAGMGAVPSAGAREGLGGR